MINCLYWYLVVLVLVLLYCDLPHCPLTEALQCYYCYQADIQEDCFWNIQNCKKGQVCAVDTTKLIYTTGIKRDSKKTVLQYKMGCVDTIVCKDGSSYGPGPYGYAWIYRECCCSNKCTKPDGTGKGDYRNCPNAFRNSTGSSNGAISSMRQTSNLSRWVFALCIFLHLLDRSKLQFLFSLSKVWHL